MGKVIRIEPCQGCCEMEFKHSLIDGLCYDCRKDFQEQMNRIDKENEKQCH